MQARADRGTEVPWWQTRSGSLGLLAAVLVVVALLAVLLANRVGDALADIGRDEDGSDPWVDPIGVEAAEGDVLVGRIPDCAAGPVTSIAIWDQDSRPIWEVRGQPAALSAFIVGATPPGFAEVTPYERPDDSTLVRLVVNRQMAGVAGVRYAAEDVDIGKVTTYYEGAYHTFSEGGFQGADICKRESDRPDDEDDADSDADSGSGGGR